MSAHYFPANLRDKINLLNICGVSTGFIALIIIGFCTWSLDRGLDFTDEAYYLLNAVKPDSVQLLLTVAHWFSSILWQLTGSIFGFRAIGLAILILSSALLAGGMLRALLAAKWLDSLSMAGNCAVVGGSISAALLYGSFVTFTPSYNLLAAAAAYSAIGFTMLSLASTSIVSALALQVLAGAMLAVSLLCKFPAGISIFGVSIALVLAFPRTFKFRMLCASILLAATALSATLIVISNTSIPEAISSFSRGVQVAKVMDSLPIIERLDIAYSQLWDSVLNVIVLFAVPILLVAIAQFVGKPWAGGIGILLAAGIVLRDGYFLGGSDKYGTQYIGLFIPVFLGTLFYAESLLKNVRRTIVILLLLSVPFAIAIGSGNPIQNQIVLSLAPWGAVMGLVAVGGAKQDQRILSLVAVQCLFLLIIAGQIITNGIRYPYRLNAPLQGQTRDVNIANLGSLKLDEETARFVDDLTAMGKRCGIRPNTSFLGFYNIPGVALLLDGVPPVVPWLYRLEHAEAVLKGMDKHAVASAVVGLQLSQNGTRPHSILPKQLGDFPHTHDVCGRVTIPYQSQVIEVWMPKQ